MLDAVDDPLTLERLRETASGVAEGGAVGAPITDSAHRMPVTN
jgi:hypothetical protein